MGRDMALRAYNFRYKNTRAMAIAVGGIPMRASRGAWLRCYAMAAWGSADLTGPKSHPILVELAQPALRIRSAESTVASVWWRGCSYPYLCVRPCGSDVGPRHSPPNF
jgi:hypothetical protein